jgi:thiamine transport system permease protein
VYSRAPRLLWWLPTGAVTLFCIVPFIALAHRAIGPDWPARAVGTAALRQVWWFTTWQAAASTALTLALALPVTWAVARHRVPGGRALTAGLTVPFLLPSVVVGAAFLALLPRTMHGTAPAILLAHAWFNLAVVVRVVGPRWSSIDPALGEAAATLGARPATVARTVTAPLLAPAVASASAVVFVLCFTSYGVVRLLGGAARATVESEIVLRAVLLDDLPTAVALAAAQFAVVGTAVFWWTARGTRAATRPVERVAPRHARGPRVVAVLAIVTAAWLVATLPLVAIAIRSVRINGRFSLAGWRAIDGATGAIGASLANAAVAAPLAVAMGLAAAACACYGSRRWRAVEALALVPVAISSVTIGLGILVAWSSPPFDLRATPWIVPVAHSLVALPIVVRTLVPVMRAIPARLAEAAATLGAAPWHSWRTVHLPLLARPLAAASALSVAVSIGEFGATSLLGRRSGETLPVLIQRSLSRPGDVVQARAWALATLLVAVGAAAVAVADWRRR